MQTIPEKRAFEEAAHFSLDRNRNARLARIGKAIATGDDELMSIRSSHKDLRFAVGFDIATGIFGDPTKGASGNTQLGPGSQAIRDHLSLRGQEGFDRAVSLHLSRNYTADPPVE